MGNFKNCKKVEAKDANLACASWGWLINQLVATPVKVLYNKHSMMEFSTLELKKHHK